ncbi:MAG: prolyl oligopeptidase family serine peptidase [Terriglobia bacterium]|jgi:dipeptidyl aminopeptidase/acylaminoacyl peptidase
MQTIKHVAALLLILMPSEASAGVTGTARSGRVAHSTFTIQQVLSAPFPTDLVAAPAADRFAWVYNAEGTRNVWVAERAHGGTAYASWQLTKYFDDEGQSIGELAWTPDAQSVVYVRGGDLEFSDKPYPNPARFVQGMVQDIWIVPLSGGEPRKVGEGHSPAVSPKGDLVAYIFKGQIWLANLDGGEEAQQLIHSRGESSSLRWSPDGRYLAFVSKRGDHSLIGVYAMASQKLSYMQPSTNYDSAPVWSPDSQTIAFLRIPSSKETQMFEPKRTGEPWSILVAQADTGEGREIWKSSPGRGSAFWEIVAENQIFWGAGDQIVFPWEADGWNHLYSVSVNGGASTLLTPGSFEVEYASLSPDRKTLVYSSNQDDVDRRHVWRVAVGRNPPSVLTGGSGIETAPVIGSDNQTVAVLRSDARVTMRPAIVVDPNEIRDLAPDAIPADFPAAQLVTPEQVIFSATDGMQIHGQLFLPPNASDGTRHPAIAFFHGGSRRQMLLGWHDIDYYSNAYGMNQFLASRGYVVLSVNYRSGTGYGLDFREALRYGASGASEYNDVEGAGMYLRSRSDVDPKRIGLWGGSYGGYLTAMGLSRSSHLFAAGVDMHGVHDWNVELSYWIPGYNPDSHPDAARLAWESSPIASVQTWRSPVLLIQGDDDRNVPFAETVELADALRKQGVDFQEIVFPDEIHNFLMHRTWIAAYSAAANFFDQRLGSANAISSAAH